MSKCYSKKPKLVAIVGGSGAGKTWLADRLEKTFGEKATRLSLDDFYLDRSHLPATRRSKINFDHPRAIDWKNVERVLQKFAAGKAARAPKYDFATHTRLADGQFVKPNSVVIVDGLWLLRRPVLRKLFSCRIFIDCPRRIRLQRRLNRDFRERGRDAGSIRKQFLGQVAPMHDRFVRPQLRRANIVISNPNAGEVASLAEQIKAVLNSN